jgi:hypothetical protein
VRAKQVKLPAEELVLAAVVVLEVLCGAQSPRRSSLSCQDLCFCTSKASKLRTFVCSESTAFISRSVPDGENSGQEKNEAKLQVY